MRSADIVADMNGDGRAEVALAVGGANETIKEPDWGRFVIFGRTGSETVTGGRDPDGFRIDRAGSAVAVGDVNGDGAGDLVVDDAVVFGKAETAPVLTDAKDFGGFRIEDEDACPNFLEDSPPLYVAPAGDVNGDGLADIVFNCEILFGKGDHDAEGVDPPSAAGFVVKDASEGESNLHALGDVTGDGRGDLLTVDEFGGGPALVRAPALVTAPVPIRVARAGQRAGALPHPFRMCQRSRGPSDGQRRLCGPGGRQERGRGDRRIPAPSRRARRRSDHSGRRGAAPQPLPLGLVGRRAGFARFRRGGVDA